MASRSALDRPSSGPGWSRRGAGAPAVVGDGVPVSWALVLEPTDETSTRLLTRGRGSYERFAVGLMLGLVWRPIHFGMQRRQLRNLKRRVEAEGWNRPRSPMLEAQGRGRSYGLAGKEAGDADEPGSGNDVMATFETGDWAGYVIDRPMATRAGTELRLRQRHLAPRVGRGPILARRPAREVLPDIRCPTKSPDRCVTSQRWHPTETASVAEQSAMTAEDYGLGFAVGTDAPPLHPD